jgi:hypothetical protein
VYNIDAGPDVAPSQAQIRRALKAVM